MREIKFRIRYKAYNLETRGARICTRIVSLQDYMHGLGFNVREGDLMSCDEYTGLKDGRGKEIYEGDIVKVVLEEDELHQVKYFGDGDDPAFDLEPGFDCEENSLSHAMACDDIEVLGNIYENSELLKETV